MGAQWFNIYFSTKISFKTPLTNGMDIHLFLIFFNFLNIYIVLRPVHTNTIKPTIQILIKNLYTSLPSTMYGSKRD